MKCLVNDFILDMRLIKETSWINYLEKLWEVHGQWVHLYPMNMIYLFNFSSFGICQTLSLNTTNTNMSLVFSLTNESLHGCGGAAHYISRVKYMSKINKKKYFIVHSLKKLIIYFYILKSYQILLMIIIILFILFLKLFNIYQ